LRQGPNPVTEIGIGRQLRPAIGTFGEMGLHQDLLLWRYLSIVIG
jgi:hypothetical protein